MIVCWEANQERPFHCPPDCDQNIPNFLFNLSYRSRGTPQPPTLVQLLQGYTILLRKHVQSVEGGNDQLFFTARTRPSSQFLNGRTQHKHVALHLSHNMSYVTGNTSHIARHRQHEHITGSTAHLSWHLPLIIGGSVSVLSCWSHHTSVRLA